LQLSRRRGFSSNISRPDFAGRLLLAGIALFSLACSSDVFEPIVTCSDDQQVVVRVSDGTAPAVRSQPRFTWEPACGMASIQVFTVDGSPGGWVVYSGERAAENPLPSGVRYGHVPPAGLAVADPIPLEAGVDYRVVVFRWIGEAGGPGSLFERGGTTFRF
jgi:hypothetical protein